MGTEIALIQHPIHKEIWIAEDGRIFRELTPSKDSGGYAQIRNGKFRQRRHVLICETFHGARPEGAVVRHRDGNPGNDAKDNLHWGTQAENIADALELGAMPKGEKHWRSKLTEAQASEIKHRRGIGEKGRDLAKEFNISESTVCDIHRGRYIGRWV